MAIDQDRILKAFAEDKLAMRRSTRAEQTLELATAFGAMRYAYCALRAGYYSAADRPTCLATFPLRSESFVKYAG
jgi:hypothetical protein